MSKEKPNPIEKAIGDRTKQTKDVPRIIDTKAFKNHVAEQIPETPSPPKMSEQAKQEIRNLPISQDLEELNRQTEEKLQDEWPEDAATGPTTYDPTTKKATIQEPNRQTEEKLEGVYDYDPETNLPKLTEKNLTTAVTRQMARIPVSKPDPQPVTETSTQESQPPQESKTDETSERAFEITKDVKKSNEQTLQEVNSGLAIEEIDEYLDAQKHDKHVKVYNKTAEKLGIPKIPNSPAEDVELTNLKKYILEDGFVLATVSFHIVSLCAEPLTTPSTTMWDFADRAKIPEMVLALLNQPGYLEGIWPSLKIVMGSNKGNSAWTAGIATTFAFFDVIRTLPTLKELKNG